ncbi:hypothetical protein ELUMI_v1c01830 [Williamsoniiplasma luminosum]|uniref:Uncharacterized protein n=1 Tax=Williamsoniiplasma luminosum TaxID=214888 RepID=A0A2K8NUR8_9MOLU|nr:hypothetical protein [Williamsoniiplasma luminosum]ATZ16908.1 hypothetical protein ELUMI_v1c01830 [Williamsoniiplasma luminosum]
MKNEVIFIFDSKKGGLDRENSTTLEEFGLILESMDIVEQIKFYIEFSRTVQQYADLFPKEENQK